MIKKVKHYQVWFKDEDGSPNFRDVYGAKDLGEAMNKIQEQFPKATVLPRTSRYMGMVEKDM